MALKDILDAIVADADKRIADAKAAHKQYMKDLREDSERRLARKQSQINDQREQKQRQLKEKAESHARMSRTKAVLARKQEYMDKLYAAVFDQLTGLPKDKTEKLLEHCLKEVHGEGTILPAKAHENMLKNLLPKGCTMGETIDAAGGFRFVSDTTEQDFTYEFMIHRLLRPATETEAAMSLFPAHG